MMTQLTKKEFYSYILKRDIVIKAIGNKHPYSTEFKNRYGDVVGVCDENNNYFINLESIKLIKEL